MSTEGSTRRGRTRRRRGRAFAIGFAIVLVGLVVIGAAAAAIGVVQGPRVTQVQVDPAAAAEASGARLIVTMSQSVATVDASQVTVEPAVPFQVDTAGRSVGVRFGLPLYDDTDYTVTFRDVTGVGGGSASAFTETFHTPKTHVYLLQRAQDGGGKDSIWRTDLTGKGATEVFSHDHIEDYRATSSHLVVVVGEDDGTSKLIVTAPDGTHQRPLPLPGSGYVTNLQSADRGEVIGYTFSDADLSEAGGKESALYTASLKDAAADSDPTPIVISGADPRVAQWRFVPDTDSIISLGFDSKLLLTDVAGKTATPLGDAVAIDGIAGTDAIVERIDGIETVDLTDGSATPLVSVASEGIVHGVLPVPGGGTLRTVTQLDASGVPESSRILFVTDKGEETTVSNIAGADAVIQTCASPSGRYAAVIVAPDIVANPYDTYQLPLPAKLQTRVVEISTGKDVVALDGSAVSWCRVPPQ